MGEDGLRAIEVFDCPQWAESPETLFLKRPISIRLIISRDYNQALSRSYKLSLLQRRSEVTVTRIKIQYVASAVAVLAADVSNVEDRSQREINARFLLRECKRIGLIPSSKFTTCRNSVRTFLSGLTHMYRVNRVFEKFVEV